jgi:hypothetical protein
VHVTGMVSFQDNSMSAGNVNVYVPGVVIFSGQAKAAGVVNVLGGGSAYFNDDSTADDITLGVYGDGFADISGHHAPGLAIGTPYADGTIFLGANNLTITSTVPHYDFSGTLKDGGTYGGTAGSLTKVGPPDSRAIFKGSSSYTGGTTISGGMLWIETGNHSTPTGTGDVHVNNGGFGGSGNVRGNVIVGTGAGTPASLVPNRSLFIQGALTFASDGALEILINSNNARASKVSAHGVTITSAAQIEISDRSNLTIAPGTVLTLIYNTAGVPITGTFANLPNGGTITVNANTYQADYEGGDGNDLTLTVVP